MVDNFKIEIISPEKIIFSDSAKMVKIPSYEGDMCILKDHISIITFLRPGLVKVEKKDSNFEEFFVQDGTIEFFNNTLILLSASVVNLKNLSKEFLDNLIKQSEKELAKENITEAQKLLGIAHYRSQDYKEAHTWLHKAAQKNDPHAQRYLGMIFFLGQGVDRDYALASKWLARSAAQGDEEAIRYREILRKFYEE